MLNAISSEATSVASNRTTPQQLFWIGLATLTFSTLAYSIWTSYGGFETLLLILGMGLGLCLFSASLGFTSAWRNLISDRRGEGVRAQMVMLGLSVVFFFPILANGEFFGNSVSGFVRPLGTSVVVGAFIFGIGMQVANGCASGNLYHSGGGQLRAVPAMVGFSTGALWATLDYEWWTGLPQLAPVGLIDSLGVIPAVLANLVVFFLIYKLTVHLERKTHGDISERSSKSTTPLLHRFLTGSWPMVWGAIGLAILNLVTLAMIGRPWAVAIAYPVWGAKAAELFGFDLGLDFTTYWIQPGRDTALMDPLLSDPGSLMNIGVILGAFVAATLTRKFTFEWRFPIGQWIGALLGGLLLGYGATISYGCNIGAFVGGVVSGSLHGWLWIVCAFAGSIFGTKIRPLFALK